MCGIGGCLGENASSDILKKMSRLVKHRGPDDYGEFVDREVALFNNRLSIIDVEGGHQPILGEDGKTIVVCNGEVYNFPEIRRDLELKGHRFRTRTDTEVIVHGYEEYGSSVFSLLNGMFAIAIWDEKRKRLLLARDRVGVKPLYYAEVKGGVVFCSEVKGILSHAEVNPEVSNYGLYCLMSLNYIPFENTLFKGVFKIPPGHYYDSEKGIEKYWSPKQVNSDPHQEGLIRKVIEESVQRQIVSDVPVGAFLSGGLDTSTVVAFASKHFRGKLKTFCMGFGHEDDELEDAKLVADHFGTDHYSFTVSDKATLELYPKMIWHSEQPKLNTYGWFVNEFASKHVKVCLSGLGGDELFFGYPTSARFKTFRIAQRLMNAPFASLAKYLFDGRRRQILSKIKNRSETYLSIISSTYNSEENQVFKFPLDETKSYHQRLTDSMQRSFFESNSDFVQQSVNAEFFTKMPDDYLSVEDSMSMAHSLETRVPLLDNELVDLMLPTPYNYNYVNGVGKALLRKAMAEILPKRCFEKPKQGFSLNIQQWWKSELGEEIRRVLPESASLKEYFDVERLKQIIPNAAESYSKVSLLWHVYAFHIWHDLFIERGKENVNLLVLPVH